MQVWINSPLRLMCANLPLLAKGRLNGRFGAKSDRNLGENGPL